MGEGEHVREIGASFLKRFAFSGSISSSILSFDVSSSINRCIVGSGPNSALPDLPMRSDKSAAAEAVLHHRRVKNPMEDIPELRSLR